MDDWKDNVFVVEAENGGVLIFEPEDYEGTKESYLKKEMIDLAENYKEMSPMELPQKNLYRDAWVLKDGRVYIDLEKAKELHIEEMKRKREEVFKKLDIQFLRCLEDNDEKHKKVIIERKQKLRNMPQDEIFNVSSVEELMKAIPSYIEY